MDEEVKNRITPMDLAKLTSIYIKIRDKRADNKRMFEAEDNDLKEQMEVLEAQLGKVTVLDERLGFNVRLHRGAWCIWPVREETSSNKHEGVFI